MIDKRSTIRKGPSRRLTAYIGIGVIVIVAELLFIYGGSIYRELATAKITGDGDSLMAGSTVLDRVRTKLESRSNHKWFSQNNARGGYRMGVEVADAQANRYFSHRLPWKTKDRIWVIGGTNDLSTGGPDRVERLLAAVQLYFEKQAQAGYPKSSCFYTDVLPRDTPSDPTFDSDRRLYNSMIRERLVGLANVIPSGSNRLLANPLDTRIYLDGTHLTEAGNEILAEDAFRVMNEIERDEIGK